MQHALQLMPINNVHSRLCAAMAYRVHYHACCVEITLNLSEWPWKEMIVDFDSIGATACDRATMLLAHHFINGIIIINTRERDSHTKNCVNGLCIQFSIVPGVYAHIAVSNIMSLIISYPLNVTQYHIRDSNAPAAFGTIQRTQQLHTAQVQSKGGISEPKKKLKNRSKVNI